MRNGLAHHPGIILRQLQLQEQILACLQRMTGLPDQTQGVRLPFDWEDLDWTS